MKLNYLHKKEEVKQFIIRNEIVVAKASAVLKIAKRKVETMRRLEVCANFNAKVYFIPVFVPLPVIITREGILEILL